ncbi:MAG: radical SAM protein [Candidatus Methylomirabilis sp.]|nr:radical SAM protein [Deltaproteobacteria bacterium]
MRSLPKAIRRKISRFQAFRAWKQGLVTLPYPPFEIWVEPTNVCNLACVMCPNSIKEKEHGAYLEMDLFEKIVGECEPFSPMINLFLGGESTMHPKCMQMAAYAKKRGCSVSLATNATLLTEGASHELIRSGIDRLVFSFDGFDKGSYEAVRVGADFERTLANIVQFLELKKKLGSRTPYVSFVSLLLRTNLTNDEETARYREFHKRLEGLPVEEVMVAEAGPWAGMFRETTKFKLRDGSGDFTPCPRIWRSMAIIADGRGVPCCADFYGEFPLGDSRARTVMEMWNGPEMVELRRRMLAKDVADVALCGKGCDVLTPPPETFHFGVPEELIPESLMKVRKYLPMLDRGAA